MKYKFVLTFIIILAIFVRVYRVSDLLGFWYDQGRDALVIWDLLYNHKFFLIGPTTGIAGIFRGPWYYWLIAPFYFLGSGNPVYPSISLGLTTVLAGYISYKIAIQIGGQRAGMAALIISCFSYNLVLSSRWLSNPTPMFLISTGLMYFLLRVFNGHKLSWIPVGFLLGQAMQFGSATEIFLFPGIFIIWLINKNIRPNFKVFALSLLGVLIGFAPQIIFDIRHDGILRQGIAKFFIDDGSFKISFWDTIKIRIPFYYQMFSSKLFISNKFIGGLFLMISLLGFRKLSRKFWYLAIIFVAPLIGMLFFQGNKGNVYDYYFTGFYLVFVVLFSVLISRWKPVFLAFTAFFLYENVPPLMSYLRTPMEDYSLVTLSNELKAVDWIYVDTGSIPFNTDFYVPPMIPYSYQYLVQWRGKTRYNNQPTIPLVKRLYTIQEPDSAHQTLLDTWMTRQSYFSSVEVTKLFGPLTVQRRARHDY